MGRPWMVPAHAALALTVALGPASPSSVRGRAATGALAGERSPAAFASGSATAARRPGRGPALVRDCERPARERLTETGRSPCLHPAVARERRRIERAATALVFAALSLEAELRAAHRALDSGAGRFDPARPRFALTRASTRARGPPAVILT